MTEITDTMVLEAAAVLVIASPDMSADTVARAMLRAALSAASPFMGAVRDWQPMDTAPRDGSEFFAYGSYRYPGDKADTQYFRIVWYSGDSAYPWEDAEGQSLPEVYSHWMPLPEAPDEGAVDADETISAYEFMAREFDRLAILRKMWNAAEVAATIRRMEIPSPSEDRPAPARVAEPVAWQDDPAADERWQAGFEYATGRLCTVLGVLPSSVDWDVATETLDGDADATILKILHAKYGEDWSPSVPQEAPAEPVAWEVAEAALHRSWGEQIDKLARFILNEVPGEPAQSEGAVDTAIRWMRAKLAVPAAEPAPPARQDALTLELGLARNALDTQLGHLFLMRKAVEAEDGKRQLLFRIDAMQRQIHDFLAGATALAAVPATEAREGE